MNEDPDGAGPQRVEGAQQVAGRISIEPVDDVSFTEHNECLQTHSRHERSKVRGEEV